MSSLATLQTAATYLSCSNCGRRFSPYPGHDVGYERDCDFLVCEVCLWEDHFNHCDGFQTDCATCLAVNWIRRLKLYARAVRLFLFKLWGAA